MFVYTREELQRLELEAGDILGCHPNFQDVLSYEVVLKGFQLAPTEGGFIVVNELVVDDCDTGCL